MNSGNLSLIFGTVAAEKQRVVALKKRTFLIRESPVITTVGMTKGGVVDIVDLCAKLVDSLARPTTTASIKILAEGMAELRRRGHRSALL